MRIVIIVKVFGKEWWREFGDSFRKTEVIKLAGTIFTLGVDFAVYI